MGRVFEGEHVDLSKKVAVKVPLDRILEDDVGLERFRREPRLAAATGHPGIVDVYDVGTDSGGVPYVVMEYLLGESLASYLARKERLDVSLATCLVAQVLAAVGAAHANEIIHRDLKPDNVFLVESGQAFPSVKVLDFGTSKFRDGSSKAEKLTESGVILGTPYYMAPEQILDAGDLDQRLDIYAIGVIFYQLVTGRLPFLSTNVLSLAHKVLNETATRPRELRPDLPDGLERVIMRAMARDPRHRYGSANSMLQALLPYLDERALGQLSLPEAVRAAKAAPSGGEAPSQNDVVREDPESETTSETRLTPTISKTAEPRPKRWSAAIAAAALLLAMGGGLRFLSNRVADAPPPESIAAPGASDPHPAADHDQQPVHDSVEAARTPPRGLEAALGAAGVPADAGASATRDAAPSLVASGHPRPVDRSARGARRDPRVSSKRPRRRSDASRVIPRAPPSAAPSSTPGDSVEPGEANEEGPPERGPRRVTAPDFDGQFRPD